MRESSRYLVGVDLGTTNSVVAYQDTHEHRDISSLGLKVFEIPQLVQPGEVRSLRTLPSFLYLPSEDEVSSGAMNLPWEERPVSIAGTLARERGALAPGRQISSAKSWLCEIGTRGTTKVLPHDAEPGVTRMSPVEATAHYLRHIRSSWNQTIGVEPTNTEQLFENQDIVLTVPASFNEEARELTVEAAQLAGLGSFTLLEEPIAAFYAWLAERRSSVQENLQDGDLVLICDIGGGTTDFSLVRARIRDSDVQFERTAIGQHLLLGGDNLDLALAHRVEQKLHGAKLSLRQRHGLSRICCAAKERLLSEPDLERLPIHLLGGGRSVVGEMLSAVISRDEVVELLTSGFLPITRRDEMPIHDRPSGLRELGLPYQSDPAITKHLAAFLAQAAVSMEVNIPPPAVPASGNLRLVRPDAILFNGGFCAPDIVRDRIVDAVASWFDGGKDGWRPKLLVNREMSDAVAQGATYYGAVRKGAGLRVKAGAARSYFIAIRSDEGVKGVCVLPSGAAEGTTLSLDRRFSAVANRPVSFTLYSSTVRHARHGEIAPLDGEQFYRHAPLVTLLRYGKKLRDVEIAVRLSVSFTEVGTLELWCEAVDSPHRWRLQFELRSSEPQLVQGETREAAPASPVPSPEDSTVSNPALESAERLIRAAFGKSNADAGDEVTPATIMSGLVAVLGTTRESWPLAMVRRLCDVLLNVADGGRKSPAHEARWLNLFGFCLRPGFGEPQDKFRINQSRKIFQAGLAHPGDLQCQVEWLVIWRRISAGLSATHQQELRNYLSGLGIGRRVKRGRINAQVEREGWRLLASLEHLSVSTRSSSGYELLRKLKEEAANSDRLWALGRLGARIPFYGSLNSVVPAATAADWIRSLLELHDFNSDCASCIVQLGWRTGDRARDIDDDIRAAAIKRIVSEGLQDDVALRALEDQIVPGRSDVIRAFGETLPEGLRLDSTVSSLSPVTALS